MVVLNDMNLSGCDNLEPQFVAFPVLWNVSFPQSQQFQKHIKFNAHLFWLHNVNKKPFTRYCGRYKNKETAWNFTDYIRPRLVVRHNKKETSQITFHNPSSSGLSFSANRVKQKPLNWLNSHFSWPELALMHRSIKSFPLCVYYSFLNNTNNSLNNPA